MELTKEDADKRSSLPYPMELGSPAFAPINVEKEKDIILNVGKLQAQEEYDRIMEQVAVLKNQADRLVNRLAVSEMMHGVVYGFKPVHGKTYYLYLDTSKDRKWLSINHPKKWSTLGSNNQFVMAVRMRGDSTWEEIVLDPVSGNPIDLEVK